MNTPPDAKQTDWPSWAGLAFIAVAFGSAFYFNALALGHFPVEVTGASRVILVALTLVPACLVLGQRLPNTPRLWGWAAVYGFVGMLTPFYLLVWAQTFLPTNVASAFFASIPLMILLLSRVILRVTITWRKVCGLMVGSAGLIYLAGPGTLSQLGGSTPILPQLAMIAACFCFALNSIIIRKMPAFPPVPMTAAAGILALPIAIANWPSGPAGFAPIAGLLAVGIVSTAIGISVRFWLIRRRGPVFITPNGYLGAIVGVGLGVLLLGENLTQQTLLAVAIIFAGLLIAEDGSGRMRQV